VMTAFTTMFKFLLHHIEVAPFVSGFIASANYALSFVGIQLLGFTLATKQPAMTATVLAEKIGDGDKGLEPLIDEVMHMLRTQITSVIGNVTAVIPTMTVIYFAFSLTGHPLSDPAFARKTIDSFSITGLTPFFAAWTGVLLWASSVFAGLFANWFNFRGLPDAIEHHPRLSHLLGVDRTRRIAAFLRRQAGSFAASVSLGFLLGMSAPLGEFLGIPMQVRHVTLSSGTMVACVLSIGPSILSERAFWLGVAGIGSMAVLNLAVSFALALMVAIWAKKATAPSLIVMIFSLIVRIVSSPKELFLAVDETEAFEQLPPPFNEAHEPELKSASR
jgi:site-specific recombinase